MVNEEQVRQWMAEIVQCRALTKKEFDGDPRARVGFESAKNSAAEKIAGLEKEIGGAISKGAIAVFVGGTAAAQFQQTAQDAGAICVDVSDLLKPAAENLHRTIGTQPVRRTLSVNHAGDLLRDILSAIQASGWAPNWGETNVPGGIIGKPLPDERACMIVAREVLKTNGGLDPFRSYVERKASSKIMELGLVAPFYPVFVFGVEGPEETEIGRNIFGTGRYTTITISSARNAQDERAVPKAIAFAAKTYASTLPEETAKQFLQSFANTK